MKRLNEKQWQGNRDGATVRSLGAFVVDKCVWAGDPGCSGGGYDIRIEGVKAGLWSCEKHGDSDLLAYIGPLPDIWELFPRNVCVDAGMISLGSGSGMCKTHTAFGDGGFPIWVARDDAGVIVGVKITSDWAEDSDEGRYFEEEARRYEEERKREEEDDAEWLARWAAEQKAKEEAGSA